MQQTSKRLNENFLKFLKINKRYYSYIFKKYVINSTVYEENKTE